MVTGPERGLAEESQRRSQKTALLALHKVSDSEPCGALIPEPDGGRPAWPSWESPALVGRLENV